MDAANATLIVAESATQQPLHTASAIVSLVFYAVAMIIQFRGPPPARQWKHAVPSGDALEAFVHVCFYVVQPLLALGGWMTFLALPKLVTQQVYSAATAFFPFLCMWQVINFLFMILATQEEFFLSAVFSIASCAFATTICVLAMSLDLIAVAPLCVCLPVTALTVVYSTRVWCEAFQRDLERIPSKVEPEHIDEPPRRRASRSRRPARAQPPPDYDDAISEN